MVFFITVVNAVVTVLVQVRSVLCKGSSSDTLNRGPRGPDRLGGSRIRAYSACGPIHATHMPYRQSIHGDETQENAFRRWLAGRPNAHVPRAMPTGWSAPNNLHVYPNTPGFPVPGQPIWQHTPAIPVIPPGPVKVNTWNHQPNTMNTPFPWLAHPQPHPSIPAHQFWQFTSTPWIGPFGQPATSAALINPNFVPVVTGGYPLPGQDATWTPGTAWIPTPAVIGQPGMTSGPSRTVVLAPWLIANPRNSVAPQILWDTAVDHPSTIKRLTGRGDVVPLAGTSAFDSQATYPAADEIVICIPKMRPCWGSVRVKKKDKKPHVRVCDIFEAVYKYLHTRLTSDDILSIQYGEGGGGMDRYRRIEYEAWRRCANSYSIPEYERLQGFKRVDVLEGVSLFWGMWPCYTPDGRWYLSMSFCPSKFSSRLL